MVTVVSQCNSDSVNCGTTYRVDNLHHFLCWSPGDNVQRPPPLRHYLIIEYVVRVRPGGNPHLKEQRERELAYLPSINDVSSKHPTIIDSKDVVALSATLA